MDPILEIEGIEVDKNKLKIESPLRTLKYPRRGNENLVNALYCYLCRYTPDA